MTLRLVIPLVCLLGYNLSAAEPFRFEDATEKAGLAKFLENHPQHRAWRYAHGAGWGDVNGDGRPDLYIGAFAGRPWFQGEQAPVPNMLFLGSASGFVRAEEENVQFLSRDARCAGVLLADLDNDGDLDLLVANHASGKTHLGSKLFENTGGGKFRDVTPESDVWPGRIGMRNVSVIDFNHDSRLDLVIADGSYGRNASAAARLIVLENKGKFQFESASDKLGLPEGNTLGLGLAIGDVNQDGEPDIFVAGSNRLFVSTPGGKFREAHAGRFSAPPADVREGMHCGASFGDLNGDDLLDLVTTEHGVPARIHVWMNRGVKEGLPDLVEVSEAAGVGSFLPVGTRELPNKTTHVALEDMDNDGVPDLVLGVIYKDDAGRVQPVILKNLSSRGGELRFSPPPYEKMAGYYAPAPVADYDRDGRLDMFLPSWFEQLPNYLMHNVTDGGNWLTVRVQGKSPQLNPMGIGAVVRIYAPGHLGEQQHQLGRRDIVVGTGYAGTEEALGHFGLGKAMVCDLEVVWQGCKVQQKNVAANQLLSIDVK